MNIRMAKESHYTDKMEPSIKRAMSEITKIKERENLLLSFVSAYQRICEHDFKNYPEGFCPHNNLKKSYCTKCGVLW